LITITNTDTDTQARRGILKLSHGTVETPAFMPVGTAAAIKGVYPDTTADLGYTLILANTYHLLLRPGVDIIKNSGGVRGFSAWKHNILTDSGGYQVFSLSRLRKIQEEGISFQSHIDGSKHILTPESVVDAQVGFNSDIQMVLDVCTAPDITHEAAREAMDITTRWLKRAKSRWEKHYQEGYTGQLFGIIQGNFFPDLRREHAVTVVEQDTPGVAIGGLSVGESFDQYTDILGITAELIPSEKPRYVMGIGTPNFILEAVAMGIDMFDCVLPTRIARNGSILTRNGIVSMKRAKHRGSNEALDSYYGTAPQLQSFSRGYLHHLFNTNEILGPMIATHHNLFFMQQFMSEIRESITKGTFSQFSKRFLDDFYGDTE
jgi:queuine tRNA-ribosyltransferase